MSTTLAEIENQARQLSFQERAKLAHTLIRELDSEHEEDIETLWIEEAESRLDAYLKGELEALPGEEVMARGREMLK
ncbi:MAG: addiction module protein [Pyrinomonadaceae bacterium]